MLPPTLQLESNRTFCVFSAIVPHVYRGVHRSVIRRRPRNLRVGFGTDGFNLRLSDTDLLDDDGYDNTTIHARVGVKLTESLDLELVRRETSSESQFDGCFSGFNQVNECLSVYLTAETHQMLVSFHGQCVR